VTAAVLPLRLVLWALVPLTMVVLLDDLGHPVGATATYFATWALTVVLPGTLLWRTLTGGRTWAQDLGFGTVLGYAWALGVWAAFTALGRPDLQWSATLALCLALLPVLRRRRPGKPQQWWLPLMVLGLTLSLIRTFVEILRLVPLPPAASARSQDIWFQLGLVRVLEQHVVAEAQLVGETLGAMLHGDSRHLRQGGAEVPEEILVQETRRAGRRNDVPGTHRLGEPPSPVQTILPLRPAERRNGQLRCGDRSRPAMGHQRRAIQTPSGLQQLAWYAGILPARVSHQGFGRIPAILP